MKGIKAAIFDLDGTLIDSMGVWQEADRLFLTRRGLEHTRDYSDAVKAMHFATAAAYTIERFGLKEMPEEVIAEWRSYVKEEYDLHIPLKDGALEYLKWLDGQGVKIALATSNEQELCGGTLKRLGIDRFVRSVTCTHEVSRPKDFPDVYLLAAQRLGVEPREAAVYEDSLKGLRAAKDGGFVPVAVYDDASAHDWAEMERIAHRAVRDLRELMA